MFAAFLVAAGRLADLLGRRRLFVFGLEVFTAASVLCAVAPSAGLLVAFRIVQALGAAFLVPASVARLHPRADVAYVDVLDAEPAVVSLVWRPDAGPIVRAFVDVARRAE